MLYAITWFLVLALLAIWSMGVWGLHSFAAWSITGVGALADHSPSIEQVVLPGWVALWAPSELILAIKASTETFLPWVFTALSALPNAVGWLGPLAWLLWSIGFAILAFGGVTLHALIAMARKKAAQ
jgi:hypothetical protein